MPAPSHPFLLSWLQQLAHGQTGRLPDLIPAAWRSILDSAHRHCLIPLLFQEIERSNPEGMPEEIRQEFRAIASRITAKNLLLASALAGMLRAARERHVACLALRGVALAEELHHDIALRPTGDLDVLVKREQLVEVRRLLTALGWYEVEPHRGFAVDFDYTLEWFSVQDPALIVEPHWSLAYPPFTTRIDMSAVWAHGVARHVVGVESVTLAPEDLLLHLCLHALHHDPHIPLLWLYELDRLMRTTPLDWTLLRRLVHQARLEPLIDAVLRRVRSTFDTPLPKTLLREFSSVSLSPFERRLAGLLTQSPDVRGRERMAVLLSLPGWGQKLRYLVAFLFPSPTFLREQHGASSWWRAAWIYPLRLWIYGWRGATALLRFCVQPLRPSAASCRARS